MKHWKDAGEEWSKPWGTSAAQWEGAILPRIRDCVPTGTILEIAPGFGRWTHYLKDYCDNLWIVERSEQCFEACRRRFGSDSQIKIYHNDGRSLSMLPDQSIDFVFTFDSLVHVRPQLIQAYLQQLGTKLKVGGKGFFHHSNLGAYSSSARDRLPKGILKLLQKSKILDWEHHRTPSMTADLFRALCEENGLQCLTQELVNWRGRRLIDCFSLFVRDGPEQGRPTKIIRNQHFMREAAAIRRSIPSATQ